MPDETPRRRTNLHDPHLREREEPQPPRLGFTGFQIGVCVLCILVAVGMRMAGGSTLTKAQTAVSQALGNRDAGGQLQTVFRALKAYFPDVKEVFQSAASGTVDAPSSAAAGSSGSDSSASSASASSAAASSAAASSAAAGSSAASGSAASGQSAASSAVSGGSQTASQTASASSTAVSSRLPGVTNVRTAGGAV